MLCAVQVAVKTFENRDLIVQKSMISVTYLEKKAKTFFCIILNGNFCVKIIPKLEKNTTQVQNMCYNIHGKKRDENASVMKNDCLPLFSFALTA